MRIRKLVAAAAMLLVGSAAGAQQPVELKLGFWTPPMVATNQKVLLPWIEAVTASSEGTLKLTWFKGETLGNARTIYDNVLNGVADVGWVLPDLLTGRFPRLSVAGLEFIAEGLDSEKASVALWRTFAGGALDEDFVRAKPLAINLLPIALIHSTFPVRRLEDLKGRKINAGAHVEIMRRMGAVPVPVPLPELYQSLQKGVIEGTSMPWTGTTAFRIQDVTRHHVATGWHSGYTSVLMNRKVFDGLPAKAKAAIEKHSGEALSRSYGRIFDVLNAEDLEAAQKKPGHEIVALAPEEAARWRQFAAPIIEDWVKATPDGARILAAYRAEVEKVRAER
jgi:TRAP-type C4-dicarboxylate transport system substrate-binding protein